MNDLEQMAIDRLKAASEMSLMAYQQPLGICISGGKDSGVITELAVRSGIPCEFQHNHTTADAPEIDGIIYVTTDAHLNPGDIVDVKVTANQEYDLIGRHIP